MKSSQKNQHKAVPMTGWLGGKRSLAKTIVPMIDGDDHDCYVEPFVGMGGIFLRRAKRPKSEVINDRHSELTNLYRIIARHPQALCDELSLRLASRADFYRLRKTPPECLTDIERAARFLHVQAQSFGGRVTSPTFGTSATSKNKMSVQRLIDRCRLLHGRLDGVTIECLDAASVIEKYDLPRTLFYLDPPYIDCETDYGKGIWSPHHLEQIAEHLKQIKGRFILSINDKPAAREMFGWADLRPVSTIYHVRKNTTTPAAELIVSTV